MFSGFFWGVFLILLGAAIILKALYHINIPVFRIFIALLIIAFGIKFLLGGTGLSRRKGAIAFEEGVVEGSESQKEYNVMFGKGVIDLRQVQIGEKNMRVEINVVFGVAAVRINPDTPAQIRTNTAFGGVRMPDESNAAFGTYVFNSKGYDAQKPHLIINANVIFAGMEISQ
jgi:hypothetical protein